MELLILGYSLLITEMCIVMLLVAFIWRWLAKIKLRTAHILLVMLVGAVILVVTQEIQYRAAGSYGGGNSAPSIGFVVMAVYLVI